jgi:hypothetical protein
MRVKNPEFKQQPEAGEKAKRMLQAMRGVTEVTFTPLTGSLVILYNPRRTAPERISERLSDCGWFDAREVVSADDYVRTAMTQAGMRLGRVAVGWALGKALEKSGLSLLAALI